MDDQKKYKNNNNRNYFKLYKKYKTKYLKLLLFGGDINNCFKLSKKDFLKSANCNIKLKDGKIISIIDQLKTNIFASCFFELSQKNFISIIKNNLKNGVESLYNDNKKCYKIISTLKNKIELDNDISNYLTSNDLKIYKNVEFPIKSVLHVDNRIKLLEDTWKNHYGKIEKNLLKMPYDYNISDSPYWLEKDEEIKYRDNIYQVMIKNTNIIRDVLGKMEYLKLLHFIISKHTKVKITAGIHSFSNLLSHFVLTIIDYSIIKYFLISSLDKDNIDKEFILILNSIPNEIRQTMEGGVKQAAKIGILTFIPIPQVRLLWDIFTNSPATIFLISNQIINLIKIHYKKNIEDNIITELDKIYKKKE